MTLLFLPHWRAEMPSSPTAPLHDSLKKCEWSLFFAALACGDAFVAFSRLLCMTRKKENAGGGRVKKSLD